MKTKGREKKGLEEKQINSQETEHERQVKALPHEYNKAPAISIDNCS